MKLVISKANRIHRPGCRYARDAEVWTWALREDRVYVALEIQHRDLSVCSLCRPMSLERDREERA